MTKEEAINFGEMWLEMQEDSKNSNTYKFFEIAVKTLKQAPKTGHWIMIDKELQRYKCSECGEVIRLYKKSEIPKLEKDETLSNYPFSHCGARMIGPQESEDEKCCQK